MTRLDHALGAAVAVLLVFLLALLWTIPPRSADAPCRPAVLVVPLDHRGASECPHPEHAPEAVALPDDAGALAYLCVCPEPAPEPLEVTP
jgi:hypothetical protein